MTLTYEDLPIDLIGIQKPGLLGHRPRVRRSDRHQDWSVPLVVTLPVTVVVGLTMWAGLALAVRALIF